MPLLIYVLVLSSQFIINCTICAECDLDVNILEKTCNFSYHWALVCEGDTLFCGLKASGCVKLVRRVVEL
jgi:hypothetical protein